ncbi:MAG: hypothetical protein J6V72_15005 [Kiritimatiellae bacterium]|nr:hypothetical protein [Kiritimatiellia bacterium]
MSTVLAALISAASFGLHVEVRPGAVPESVSTEVSTNIPFNAVRSDVREVRMHFTFEGVSSNCIQVAFGRDADGDGVLSFDETDAVYGWRNGRHFAEDVKTGVRTEEPEAATGRALSVRMRMTKESLPAHFAATNGVGVAVLGDIASSVPTWVYRPEWNLMRVTRRGPGVPAEWFLCDIKYNEFFLIMR